MARITLSDLIIDIRGKVGQSVYSIWKGIHLVKQMPINFMYPWGSAYNWVMRKLVDECTERWKKVLSLAQKNAWEQYSDYLGALGGLYAPGAVDMIPGLRRYAGIMSGFNAYTLTNALRRTVGYSDFLDDAPNGQWFPPQPAFQTFYCTITPKPTLHVTLTPLAPGALDFWLVVWCRGKAYAHLLAAKILRGENVGSTSWNTMHYPRGVSYDILSDDYQAQMIYITSKGTFSPWSNFKEVIVPYSWFGLGLWNAYVWDNYAWDS